MTILETALDTNSEAFKTNVQFMQDYVEKIRVVERNIRKSEEAYRERATRRGKLLPRERLAHLLDRGSPFLELSSIAGYRMDGDKDGSTAGGNIVVGYRLCIRPAGTGHGVELRDPRRHNQFCDYAQEPAPAGDCFHESPAGHLALRERRWQSSRRR